MRIQTNYLNNYIKLLSKIPTSSIVDGNDFLLLDPSRNSIFLESKNFVASFPFPFTSGSVPSKDLILSRSELLNLMKLEEELEISDTYFARGKYFKGKLKTSVNRDILNHIPTMFEDFDGKDFLFISDEILSTFSKAVNFINSQDASVACQSLHIKDSTVITSSHKRVFLSTINLNSGEEIEGVLHNELIQFILLLGEGTKIMKGENCYLLQNKGIQIIFDARIDVDVFPFTGERFLGVLDSLKNSSNLHLSVAETLKQIDFLMFYAKSQTNSKTLVRVEGNQIHFLVGENEVKITLLPDSSIVDNEDEVPGSKEFYINLEFLKNILTKMLDSEIDSFHLFENSKLMILLLNQKEGEEVIMGKINN